jgi:hypothetical protein
MQLHCSRKRCALNRVALPHECRPHASSCSTTGISPCQPQPARTRAPANAVRTQQAQVRLARPRARSMLSCCAIAPRATSIASHCIAGPPATRQPPPRAMPSSAPTVSSRAPQPALQSRLLPTRVTRVAATSTPAQCWCHRCPLRARDCSPPNPQQARPQPARLALASGAFLVLPCSRTPARRVQATCQHCSRRRRRADGSLVR